MMNIIAFLFALEVGIVPTQGWYLYPGEPVAEQNAVYTQLEAEGVIAGVFPRVELFAPINTCGACGTVGTPIGRRLNGTYTSRSSG